MLLRTAHHTFRKTRLLNRSYVSWKLDIENISEKTNKKALISHFEKTGRIDYACAHREEPGKGFVSYRRKWELELAIEELNNSELHGNILKLIPPADMILRSNISKTNGIKVENTNSKAFWPNKAIIQHFLQYGEILSHKSAKSTKDSANSCYILFYEQDAAVKARANPNPSINGVAVKVKRDDWVVPERDIFFLTPHELCHEKLKDYFSSFGNVLKVKKISIHKEFIGYSIQFSKPEDAKTVMKETDHEIDSVKVQIHTQDTRHAIDIKRKEERSVTVGPIFESIMDYGEIKEYFSKFGNIVYIRLPTILNSYSRRYYKVLYEDRESVMKVLEAPEDHVINDFRLNVFSESLKLFQKSKRNK